MRYKLNKLIIILSLIFPFSSLTPECLYYQYYNSLTSQCTKCSSAQPGCLQCIERSPSILCLECLPGHTQLITNNEITSCIPECNKPSTVLKDILPRGPLSPCEMAIWSNKHLHQVQTDLIDNTQRATSSKELNALVFLYKSLNGDIWLDNRGWNSNDPCIDSWYGIECNVFGNVIGINFNQNGLHGIIPDNIIDLTHLKHIHISNTLFEGTLPSANRIFKVSPNVFLLPEIDDIMLVNVNLKQDLASIISMATFISSTIEIIDLSFNKLFGVMPSFASFTNLKVLNLSFNEIKGDLSMLSTLPSSVYDISLQNNFFEGTIPPLSNVVASLEYFDLRNNTITGMVPPDFFSDTSFLKLQYIGLMMTNVTVNNECKDIPFCIKRLVKGSRSIYDDGFDLTAEDLKYLRPRRSN